MYIQILSYQFKGSQEKQEGIDFLKKVLFPHESQKTGFLSHTMADGENDDVFVLYKYENEGDIHGDNVDIEAFKKFSSTWERPPLRLSGLNRAG